MSQAAACIAWRRKGLILLKKRFDEEPHIVEEFKIGNTTIKIADNYCLDKVKDKDKIDRILQKIAQIGMDAEIARNIAERNRT